MTAFHWGDGDPKHKSLLHLTVNWEEDWENICNKELFYNKLNKEELIIISKNIKEIEKDKDICYSIIKNKLLNIYKNKNESCDYTSFPKKKNKKCI